MIVCVCNRLNQLTGTDYSNIPSTGADVTYGYDVWGNRTSLTTPLGTVAYTVAADSNELQIVSRNNGLLSQTFTYDGNGAMASEQYTRLGTNVRRVDYAFDAQGRLTGLTYTNQTGPTVLPNTLAFAYSDDGNRVGKSVNGVWSYTLNDGLTALDELDSTGAVIKTMVRGLDAIAEIDAAGNIQFMHQDALGSTIMITDNTGAIVGRYEYDAFGQIVGADGTAESKYLFTGQEFDPESELTYMNARYYNADLGRFISRDPMLGRAGDLISRNGYVYVKNNPLKWVDPTGETEEHGLWGAITGFLGQTVDSFNNLNAGIIDAFSSNLSWGASDLVFYNNGSGTSYDVGRVIGNGASIVQGSFEFVGGLLVATGGTGGGAALCVVTAGGGCVAAVGSIVVGGAAMGHGGGMIVHAINGNGGNTGGPRITNPSKQESPVWNSFENYKNGIKRNGLKGGKAEYYTWDNLHNEIEVYDQHGVHTGVIDPNSGLEIKKAVPGRRIDL